MVGSVAKAGGGRMGEARWPACGRVSAGLVEVGAGALFCVPEVALANFHMLGAMPCEAISLGWPKPADRSVSAARIYAT
jgi:hypothetical protein